MPIGLKLEPALGGQIFTEPTGLYPTPDGRFIVLEKPGTAVLINADGTNRQTVLDISDKIKSDTQEEGLLGLALAPDFAASGVLYLTYVSLDPHSVVLSRFLMKDGSIDRKSEQVLIDLKQDSINHKGGQIFFGPDGYLYVGFGDGVNPQARRKGAHDGAQEPDELYGKILRIDVSGKAGGKPYKIPPDNPFAGEKDAAPEVWAIGFRNPWRFSIDPVTNRMWLTDVGDSGEEEVDVIDKGKNYGWNYLEGHKCLVDPQCKDPNLTPPLTTYLGENGVCAIIGGFVYRGPLIAALRGAFVYGDFCSGRIWALRYDGSAITQQTQIAQATARISSFALDLKNNLYVVEYGPQARIFKLVP